MTNNRLKTPWTLSAVFYWAFLWRTVVLFLGMGLAMYACYWIIQILLESWPLAERLLRLIIVLGLMTLAMCFALQWCMQARYGDVKLHGEDTTITVAPNGSPSWRKLVLRDALQVVWAHIWRYIVVLVPINVPIQWLLIGPIALQQGEALNLAIGRLAIDTVLGLAVGVWAMREALSVRYRTFRLLWIKVPTSVSQELDTGAQGPRATLDD